MKTDKFRQFSTLGTTIVLAVAITAETVAMHDPRWHIETNGPQNPTTYRYATIISTSSYNTPIKPGTGAMRFG